MEAFGCCIGEMLRVPKFYIHDHPQDVGCMTFPSAYLFLNCLPIFPGSALFLSSSPILNVSTVQWSVSVILEGAALAAGWLAEDNGLIDFVMIEE